jgi:hypothetical protein
MRASSEPGSARVSHVGDDVAPSRTFLKHNSTMELTILAGGFRTSRNRGQSMP